MQFKDSRRLSTASKYNRGSGHHHCLPSSPKLCEQPTGHSSTEQAAEPTQRGTGPAAGPATVFVDTRSPQSPLWYHTHKAEGGSRLALGPGAPLALQFPLCTGTLLVPAFPPEAGKPAKYQSPTQHPCGQTPSGSSSSKPIPERHLRCQSLRAPSVPEHHVPSVPWQCRTYLMISRFS